MAAVHCIAFTPHSVCDLGDHVKAHHSRAVGYLAVSGLGAHTSPDPQEIRRTGPEETSRKKTSLPPERHPEIRSAAR